MIRTITLSAVLLAGIVGCQSDAYTENLGLHRQNRELQDKLDAANAQLRLSPDPAQFKQLQDGMAERDRELADLRNRPAPEPASEPAAPLTPAVASSAVAAPRPFGDLETSVDARAGTVTVTLPGDVLFGPGQAKLRPAALASLDRVATVLRRQYASRQVRIEGHTDADPIRKTAQEWTDNLDLSLARAAAVSRYLESHGVSPRLVTTSGFGPYRGRGANKARNRRVDIVVVTR